MNRPTEPPQQQQISSQVAGRTTTHRIWASSTTCAACCMTRPTPINDGAPVGLEERSTANDAIYLRHRTTTRRHTDIRRNVPISCDFQFCICDFTVFFFGRKRYSQLCARCCISENSTFGGMWAVRHDIMFNLNNNQHLRQAIEHNEAAAAAAAAANPLYNHQPGGFSTVPMHFILRTHFASRPHKCVCVLCERAANYSALYSSHGIH